MMLKTRIDGLEDFRGGLSRIAEPDGLAELFAAAAEDIRTAARARLTDGEAPESRSGALAALLTVDADRDGAGVNVGTPLDHGWHLEFGSRGRPATPWLAPSLDEARPGILAAIKTWLAASGKRSVDR